MLRVRVQGGTNAGVRVPFEGSAQKWKCRCPFPPTRAFKTNPGFLKRCPDCGHARP